MGHIMGYAGFFLLTGLILCGVVSGLPTGFCLPESGSFVLGVFAPPSSMANEEEISTAAIEAYEKAAGREVSIAVLSDEWMLDRKFPTDNALAIRTEGKVPYVRLMMRSSLTLYEKEPHYALRNIAGGKFDTDLRLWAREAKSFGSPVFVEFGTEVNQWQYPWNGYWNGNEKGPELFIEAYKRVVSVMRDEGASNIIWVFHFNAESLPDEEWNQPLSYYPGEDYVDVVAISFFGTRKPFETGKGTFEENMNRVYDQSVRDIIKKPIFLILGTDVNNRFFDPSVWIQEAIMTTGSERWPGVSGLIWWNAAWKHDANPLHDTSMRIQDNRSVETVFRDSLRSLAINENFAC